MAGSLISIIWCYTIMVVCLFRSTPATSVFTEIDFASKVTFAPYMGFGRYSIQELLSSLNESSSYQILRRLSGVRFRMGERRRISLELDENELPLSRRASRIGEI